MNKKIVIAVACILTSMCLSCAVPGPQSSVNTLNGSASPEPIQVGISEEFSSKVTLFQNEMNKFNTDLRPNEKAGLCADCISCLKDILLEKESVSASEEDIMGGDESFYLKFRYKAVIDGVTYRLAEFGVIRKEELVRERGEEMGTEKVLLLQSWKGNNDVVDVQHIYSAYISESITMLLDYELIKEDDTFYINIIDKEYTPETFVMHLTTYKYENQKWVPNIETDELTDDTWTLEVQTSENKEYLLISCANIDYRNGYGYDCRYRYRRLNIIALDNSGAVIGTLELLFDSGKWVVETPLPDTPSKEDGVISSNMSPDYLDDISAFPLVMDFDGDGAEDSLSFDIIKPEGEFYNISGVRLVIDGHKASLENVWNDGFGLKILDFDTADAFLDICVFAYGTDVSVSVYVFRYDGGKVIHYHTFNVGDDTSFTYDSKGMVYYNTFLDEPGSFRYVHASYDCRRNDVSYIDID